MARRRIVEGPVTDDAALILPRELAEYPGGSAADYRAFWQTRNAWLRANGIDPGDWCDGVYPVLKASWAAYGIEGHALARAKRALANRA